MNPNILEVVKINSNFAMGQTHNNHTSHLNLEVSKHLNS